MLRHGVRALLERHGVAVVAEASDGRTAAAAAREHHPDVAVLDIMMPLLNGIDAAREIAETCPETQVVLLTALDQERLVTAAVSAGVGGAHGPWWRPAAPPRRRSTVASPPGSARSCSSWRKASPPSRSPRCSGSPSRRPSFTARA